MDILHCKEKDLCEQCGEEFAKYEDLINHARQIHHHLVVNCQECGKEFIHEKNRLHHVREEHERRMEAREHKNLHEHKGSSPQGDVDVHRKNFSDNF